MKLICFCLLLLSLSYINTATECGEEESASSVKDCKDLEISRPDSHCCFLYQKGSYMGQSAEFKACIQLPKELYDNIKDYIKTVEQACKAQGGSCTVKKLDCKSSYLAFSLFSLILLIL